MIYIHKITGAERHINDYDIEKLGPDYHKKLSKFYDLKIDKVSAPKRGATSKNTTHKRVYIPSDKGTSRTDRTAGGTEKTPKINTKENTKEKSKDTKKIKKNINQPFESESRSKENN